MVEISNADTASIILYLQDSIRDCGAGSVSTRRADRIRLTKRLIKKLKNKLPQ